MQNNKVKGRMSAALLLALTAVFVCINPGNAFADLLGCMENESGQGIFKTIACKITTTLFDIRKIVYVLAGFGLIAFTFAAIFNKISFKHLSSIALSLFLLSMMTPFIEYFTSPDGSKTLTYGHYLQPEFTEEDYSMTFGECEGEECPQSIRDEEEEAEDLMAAGPLERGPGIDMPGATTEMGGGIKLPDRSDIDTRTGWQKFKDTIKMVAEEGVKAYNTAASVVSAASTVYNTVDSTVKGFQNAGSVSEFLTAGVNAFNGYGNITGSITSAAGTIGTNYTDKDGQPGLGEKVNDFFKDSNDIANEGKGVTQDLGTINGTINGAAGFFGNMNNMF